MHITLILLAAAGQVVTALDPHVTHLPRAANQEDNLATITTLVDGHLPTCFTGHPTYPCPTNGPQGKRDLMGGMGGLAGNPMGGLTGDINKAARIVPIDQIELTASGGKPALPTGAPKGRGRAGPRDAPMEPWDKDYIPHPSEWAVPGKFKFTDSIAHNSTGNSTGHSYVGHNSTGHEYSAPKYADHDSTAHKYTGYNSIAHKHAGHQHTGYNSTAHQYTGYNSTSPKYATYNSTAPKYATQNSTAHYSTGTTASAPTSSIEKYYVAPAAATPQSNNHYNNHYAHHHNKIHHNDHQDEYVHTSATSESVTAKAYSQTTDPPVLPTTSSKQHAVANSSSPAHVAGQIGTLLSAAMYPGMMRKPSITNTSPYAAAVTSSKDVSQVDNEPDTYSTTQIQQASVSTPCADSEVSSSSSTTPMYDVKPVTMATSSRPVVSSQTQPTASYKAAEQQTARHFVS